MNTLGIIFIVLGVIFILNWVPIIGWIFSIPLGISAFILWVALMLKPIKGKCINYL